MKRIHPRDNDYSQLKRKLLFRLAAATVGAIFGIVAFYILIWQGEGGDFVVLVLQWFLGMDYYEALDVYRQVFRSNAELLWLGAVLVTFFILLYVVLNWFTRYFALINRGIGDLLEEDSEIRLPPEMAATERKLNAVKGELKRRAREAKMAEQRKNDLVMYLAHDIRTPLSMILGYADALAADGRVPRRGEAPRRPGRHHGAQKATSMTSMPLRLNKGFIYSGSRSSGSTCCNAKNTVHSWHLP